MAERTLNTVAALRNDKIGQFLKVALESRRAARVAMAEVHAVYIAYCKFSGAPTIPTRQLARQVARRGYAVSGDGAHVADVVLARGVNDFADRQRFDAAMTSAATLK